MFIVSIGYFYASDIWGEKIKQINKYKMIERENITRKIFTQGIQVE